MSLLDRFSFQNKTIIVTGGARGIGRGVAEGFADAGASRIALIDLDFAQAEQTARELALRFPVQVLPLQCDVTDQASVIAVIDQVIAAFGPIDVLFNNAGICINSNAQDMTAAEWHKVMDININGMFYVAQAVGRQMIRQGFGSIVNTASMAATMVVWPQPQISYNTSKAAVVMLTKSLAAEWAKFNIRVNCISPGYTRTELTDAIRSDWRDYWTSVIPMRRMAEVQELVGGVIYLASEAASYTTGTDLVIDGGTTCT